MTLDETVVADEIRRQLGLGAEHTAWLAALARIEPVALASPPDADPALLARLGVPADQAEELRGAWDGIAQSPALHWLLEHCAALLIGDMGGYDPLPPLPPLPAALGAPGRYLYLWVFLAVLPFVRSYHATRGIPVDIAWDTLEDFGLHMAIHRRIHGEGGLSTPNWLALHFRGAIYRLGRLQFNRTRVRFDAEAIAATGGTFRQGDAALGVHIPEIGPLTPDGCDDSFRRAPAFFGRHFPEDRAAIATCSSWLLDEQLADYLPAESNIVRFQRRFRRTPGSNVGDDAIIQFVFRRLKPNLDDLPRRTKLERAIVAHLRAGKHWHSRSGWVAL